jgi:signal transduction histidine kinase
MSRLRDGIWTCVRRTVVLGYGREERLSRLAAWARFPGTLTAAFLVIAAVSVLTLVWLGMRLVRQDRALEAQRLQEKRESAADRVVAALDQALSADERGLLSRPGEAHHPGADGLALVVAEAGELEVLPEAGLPYYPVAPPPPQADARLYRDAEGFEFRDRDFDRAIETLRALSASRDPLVRAGAQLRLARNLRKADRAEAALRVYADLARVDDAGLAGAPADLVARRARCALLERLGRHESLGEEARALHEDLRAGRWRLARDTYRYYAGEVRRWLEASPAEASEGEALAAAVDWLWQSWRSRDTIEPGSTGRRCLVQEGLSITVAWHASDGRLAAFAAAPSYQRGRWSEPAFRSVERQRVRIALVDAEGNAVHGQRQPDVSPESLRVSSVTDLPWTVVVANADVEAERDEFAHRREMMMGGLAALALLVIAGSYLIGRALSRELAVARLQSDFVSAVSHEFRTPLTALRQFTEMLVENEDLPAQTRRRYYQAQARASARLSRLVESLLDFGRMEAGARPYRLEPLDAAELARAVVVEFRLEGAGRNDTIECDAPDGARVRADREALSQALWNLLDNAVKYSGAGRTVRVEVERDRGVALRVRDQGPGIPASETKQVFRKFARGSAAREGNVKGTGIGLAMVRHIVEAHGGRVTVESEPGAGSVFTIVLPAED